MTGSIAEIGTDEAVAIDTRLPHQGRVQGAIHIVSRKREIEVTDAIADARCDDLPSAWMATAWA